MVVVDLIKKLVFEQNLKEGKLKGTHCVRVQRSPGTSILV